MRNGPDESACDCPVECNTISYSFRVVITPFDQEELCPQRFAADASLVKPISYHRLPPTFVQKLTKIKHNNSNSIFPEDVGHLPDEKDRKEKLQYRAEVTFRMATDLIPVTVLSRRLSFFDKMSAFGKSFIIIMHHMMFVFSF